LLLRTPTALKLVQEGRSYDVVLPGHRAGVGAADQMAGNGFADNAWP
jgi:hypothetical protein